MILLNVQSVVKHFGPEPVLDGVTFEVRPRERIGLVGPNGAGKTTLLKIVAGQEQADAGTCRTASLRPIGVISSSSRWLAPAARCGKKPAAGWSIW